MRVIRCELCVDGKFLGSKRDSVVDDDGEGEGVKEESEFVYAFVRGIFVFNHVMNVLWVFRERCSCA